VNGIPAPPFVTYNAPACDEATFSLTVGSAAFPILLGAVYTVLDKNGDPITGISPASPYTATAADVTANQIIFSNIPAGSGYLVSIESSSGCPSSNIPVPCGSPSLNRATANSISPVTEENIVNTTTEQITSAVEKIMKENMTVSDLKVQAVPNPFTNQVRFVVSVPEAGNMSLEVYNMMGQKVTTVYQGYMAAGIRTFELSLPAQKISNLVYVFRIGDKQVTGKLLQMNQ
jgi:hypothetical protein